MMKQQDVSGWEFWVKQGCQQLTTKVHFGFIWIHVTINVFILLVKDGIEIFSILTEDPAFCIGYKPSFFFHNLYPILFATRKFFKKYEFFSWFFRGFNTMVLSLKNKYFFGFSSVGKWPGRPGPAQFFGRAGPTAQNLRPGRAVRPGRIHNMGRSAWPNGPARPAAHFLKFNNNDFQI